MTRLNKIYFTKWTYVHLVLILGIYFVVDLIFLEGLQREKQLEYSFLSKLAISVLYWFIHRSELKGNNNQSVYELSFHSSLVFLSIWLMVITLSGYLENSPSKILAVPLLFGAAALLNIYLELINIVENNSDNLKMRLLAISVKIFAFSIAVYSVFIVITGEWSLDEFSF